MKITEFATVGWSGFARVNKKVSDLLMVICLCIYNKQCQKGRLMRSWGQMKRKTSLKTVEIKVLAFLPHINSMTCTSCPRRVIIIIPRLGEGWDGRILVVSRKHLPSPPPRFWNTILPPSHLQLIFLSPSPLFSLPHENHAIPSFPPPPPFPSGQSKAVILLWLTFCELVLRSNYFISSWLYFTLGSVSNIKDEGKLNLDWWLNLNFHDLLFRSKLIAESWLRHMKIYQNLHRNGVNGIAVVERKN